MLNAFLFGENPLPYFRLNDGFDHEVSPWDFRQRYPLVVMPLYILANQYGLSWDKKIKVLGEGIQKVGGKLLTILPMSVPAIKLQQGNIGYFAKLLSDTDDNYRVRLKKIGIEYDKAALIIMET